MSKQFTIVDTGYEAMIDRLVDDSHHDFFEEAKVENHLRLLAGLMKRGTCACHFDRAPMSMNRLAL
jgi:hypothetical protein